MKNPYGAWFALATDSWRLALEAQGVVALRLAKLAAGDAAAALEAQRMVAEKMLAAGEIQAMTASALLAGRGRGAPKKAVAHLRRKVRANRRRLSRKRA